MKMLWDDEYFYIAADMLKPDIWATLTTRDAVIFQDNDFEVFIDPDGDTHEYYELEVNALEDARGICCCRSPIATAAPRSTGGTSPAWRSASTSAARSTSRATKTTAGASNRAAVEDSRRSLGAGARAAATRRAVAHQLLARGVAHRHRRRPVVKRHEPETKSRCQKTTGSGARRARSTCTCPSDGA